MAVGLPGASAAAGPRHSKALVVEVDVLPTEAEDFTLPQTKHQRDDPACLQPLVRARLEQGLRFVDGVGLDFESRQGGRVDHEDGIARDQAPANGDG